MTPVHPALLPGWLEPATLIDQAGSWAVAAVALMIFAECGLLIGFFLPGDTLLFVSGLLMASAHKGQHGLHTNIVLFIAVVFLAALIGNAVGYWIGRVVGPRVFSRPDALLLRPEHVDRSEHFFAKYGAATVVLARFVPVIRTVATVMAGVSRMNVRSYLGFSAAGGLVWVTGVTVAGFYLGQISFIADNVDLIFVLAVVVVVLVSAVPAFLHWRSRRRAAAELAAAE